MTRMFSFSVCAAAAAVVVSCAEDDKMLGPDEVTITPLANETIGASGGRIDIASHGVSLVFPAGALSADTEITVGERSDAPARAAGPALELGPDGTTFGAPVRLVFDVDALPPGALPDDHRFVTRAGGRWVEMGSGIVEAESIESIVAEIVLEHFSSYAVVAVDQTGFLYGTFGFAPDDVYAYGMGSVVAHYDGSEVTAASVGLGATTRLYDGFGLSASDQLCVGWDGTDGQVWRSAGGTSWARDATPGTGGRPLFGIAGDTDLTVAVGFLGRILVNAGGAWADESYLTPGGQAAMVRHLRSVAVLPGGDAIAVGDEIVLVRSGGAWSETDVTAVFNGNRFFLHGVWARSASDVYAVGREFDTSSGADVSVVLHNDGSAWSRMSGLPAGTAFHGVWGDASRVIAAGDTGQILRYENGAWADETVCPDVNETLFDVWASAPDFSNAVGGGAVFALAANEDACDDPDDGGSGEPGDLVVTLRDAPASGCAGTSWIEDDASLEIFELDGGCPNGSCGYTGNDGRVRLHPAQLRIVLPGQYQRCEVDIDNAGGSVVAQGWYAGEIAGTASTEATGESILSMSAFNSEGFYLIYVAACDADVTEVRFYLE